MHTKIEWVKNNDGSPGYSINPVKGLCPVACKDNQGKEYCYARRLYDRFKWNPEIRFDQTVFFGLPRKPSRVFVGSTIELFGDWVKREWLDTIFTICRQHNEHTFIFLTKQPQNLPKEFPPNCWVGVSTPNASDAIKANKFLCNVWASVKFLSIEPMFDWNLFPGTLCGILYGYNWLIFGSQTQPVKHPPKAQVLDLQSTARALKIPIFVKEPMASHYNIHRQEFPRLRA